MNAFARIFASGDAHLYEERFAASLVKPVDGISAPPSPRRFRPSRKGSLADTSIFVLETLNEFGTLKTSGIAKLGTLSRARYSDTLRTLRQGGYVLACTMPENNRQIYFYSITDNGREWLASNSA